MADEKNETEPAEAAAEAAEPAEAAAPETAEEPPDGGQTADGGAAQEEGAENGESQEDDLETKPEDDPAGEKGDGAGKPKKSGRKKLLLIPLALVMVAALAAGGFFFWKTQSGSAKAPDPPKEEPSGGSGEEEPPGKGKPLPAAAEEEEEDPIVLTAVETVEFVEGLSPETLGLEGDDMSAYEVFASEGVVPVDGMLCTEIRVYGKSSASDTNVVAGRYLLSRGAVRRLYSLDGETGQVTELPLPGAGGEKDSSSGGVKMASRPAGEEDG